MITTIKKIAFTAATAAALLNPEAAKAQQHSVDLHAERFSDTAISRFEIMRGPLAVFRAEERTNTLNDQTSYRAGLKWPVLNGFVDVHTEQTPTKRGYALNTELGSQHFKVGGALETATQNGERTNLQNIYGQVDQKHFRIAAGAGNFGENDFQHGIVYALLGSYTAGGGIVRKEDDGNLYHWSVGRSGEARGTEFGFRAMGFHKGGNTNLELMLTPNTNYSPASIIGPHGISDDIHEIGIRAVSDVMAIPIQPGIPAHIRTAGPGVLTLKYADVKGERDVTVDARAFPTGKLHNEGLFERIMTGVRYESSGRWTAIGEVGLTENLYIYGEKSTDGGGYLFAGVYVPIGGK